MPCVREVGLRIGAALWIECAAIRYNGRVYEAVRHNTARYYAMCDVGRWPAGAEDGFVTNVGEFVCRRCAAEIAHVSGQTQTNVGILYSEDLW